MTTTIRYVTQAVIDEIEKKISAKLGWVWKGSLEKAVARAIESAEKVDQKHPPDILQDDSIPNAFRKLRGALREQSRIYNKFLRGEHYSKDRYGPGIYKTWVVTTWGKALKLADKSVRVAVEELWSLM